MNFKNCKNLKINPFQMKKTLLTYSNYNSASTQGNSTPKRQHLNKQNIKENESSTNKEINPFNEENDINSLNIISSPEKKKFKYR
jgi:hypothetical protein